MVFSSLEFILHFLPWVIFVYFVVYGLFSKRSYLFTALNLVLFATSIYFYHSGEKNFFWVILLIGFCDFFFALQIEKQRELYPTSKIKPKVLLILSVLINMGFLFYFKYVFFFTKYFFNSNYFEAIVLPVGISFYTFESMSYIIDVYLGHVKATRRFIDYWTFITFFPHLIAGPIIRYVDLKAQLESRNHNWKNVYDGSERFFYGLGKKVILANPLGYYADQFFSLDSFKIDSTLAWIMAICYSLQIYFDFSGYSDMAIGLSRIFGIQLPENFNYPYTSQSIKEFWRRWHITLSQWFRDYLYIPLGGNRKGTIREYINLLIVFFLCGLWHGASLNFIIWGSYHGFFLIFERIFHFPRVIIPRLFKHIYALFVIICGWVIFRSESVSQMKGIFLSLFGINNHWISNDTLLLLQRPHFIIYFSLGLFFTVPTIKKWPVLVFIISLIFLSGEEYNPFIYFRF